MHTHHGFEGFERDQSPPDTPDEEITLDERMIDISETLRDAMRLTHADASGRLEHALEAFVDDVRVRLLMREIERAVREARRK